MRYMAVFLGVIGDIFRRTHRAQVIIKGENEEVAGIVRVLAVRGRKDIAA
ncbi:hypothetical protein FACS1894200_11310 [Spirochaetia bacterium]|nr:hypothetical protein FACS1894200_11310 [Spirochaetia bacterium]